MQRVRGQRKGEGTRGRGGECQPPAQRVVLIGGWLATRGKQARDRVERECASGEPRVG